MTDLRTASATFPSLCQLQPAAFVAPFLRVPFVFSPAPRTAVSSSLLPHLVASVLSLRLQPAVSPLVLQLRLELSIAQSQHQFPIVLVDLVVEAVQTVVLAAGSDVVDVVATVAVFVFEAGWGDCSSVKAVVKIVLLHYYWRCMLEEASVHWRQPLLLVGAAIFLWGTVMGQYMLVEVGVVVSWLVA